MKGLAEQAISIKPSGIFAIISRRYMQSFVNILTIMQGIYKGYPVMHHDKAWTVILTLSEDNTGIAHFDRAIEILENSGQAWNSVRPVARV